MRILSVRRGTAVVLTLPAIIMAAPFSSAVADTTAQPQPGVWTPGKFRFTYQ